MYDTTRVADRGFDKVTHAHTKSLLGECLLRQNDLVGADRLLLESRDMFQQIGVHPSGKEQVWERLLVPENLERLVRLYDALKKPAEAAKWREESQP